MFVKKAEHVHSFAPGVEVLGMVVFEGTLYVATSEGVYFKAGSRFYRLTLEDTP